MSKFSSFVGSLRPRANISWILSALLVVIFLTYLGFGVYFGLQIYKYKNNNEQIRFATLIYPFPAAIVNGKIIWSNTYYRQYTYIQRLNEKSQAIQEEPAIIREKIINLLVKNEIIEYQAMRYNVGVTNSEVNDAYDKLAAEVGGEGNIKKTLMDMYGMNERNFKKLIKETVREEKVRDEVISQVKVDHIYVKDEALAKEIVDKLKKGEDFAALAKQHSTDIKTRDNGGDLGWLAKGQLVLDNNPIPEFDEAAFNAKIGEIIGPVKISSGYEIFKVEARKGTVQQNFNDWLQDLIKKATIWRFIK